MKTLLVLLLLTTASAIADLPVSGRPVPRLIAFDTIMQDEMSSGGATAGVLGVMRNDNVIYLRGFGYLDDGATPLPENALLRIASCSKPITAAIIRQVAASGALGPQGLQRRVFNLTIDGVNNNGLLNVTPFLTPQLPILGDPRIADITVDHLIRHAGGFNRAADPFDPMFRSRQIANDMGVASPPSRHNIMRWMLGRPLAWAPGTVSNATPGLSDSEDPYSNFGYMVLGEIIAAYSPHGSYLAHLHNQLLTPDMWVPTAEITQGRTLLINRNPREPIYTAGPTGPSVFDSFPFIVPEPYGQWDLDAMLANGGIISTAASMLEFGNRYEVWYPDIGNDRVSFLASGSFHTGALDGTNSFVWPRGDISGTVVFAAFNHRIADQSKTSIAIAVKSRIQSLIDNSSIAWPNTPATSDGFWVSPGSGTTGTFGRGGYHDPYLGFAKAWNKTTAGSRIRLKPGNNPWSGVLNRKTRLDAPEGTARIGAQ